MTAHEIEPRLHQILKKERPVFEKGRVGTDLGLEFGATLSTCLNVIPPTFTIEIMRWRLG